MVRLNDFSLSFFKFETSEDERLIHNAYIWLEELKKKFPKREFKVCFGRFQSVDFLDLCCRHVGNLENSL